MKNLITPVIMIVALVAMGIIGISSQAFVLVIASCGLWNPAMIWLGYRFAHKGASARAVFVPIMTIIGVGAGGIIGLATNILPLMIVGCGGIIPALIFAGWSLARLGDDDPLIKPAPLPTSEILTPAEIKRGLAQLEKRKLAHLSTNGNGEFK